MTSIHFRPDDGGLQALKKDNAADQPTRAVSAPAATASTHSVTEQPPSAQPGTLHPPVYQGVERRKGERRREQQRILLDTRSKRERRRQPQDQHQDQPDAGDAPKVGVDLYT
jgi:hypothetical protein